MTPGMTQKEMSEVIGLATENDRFMTADKQTHGRVQTWMYGILTEAPEMTKPEAEAAIGYYYARVGGSMDLKDLIDVWEEQKGKTQSRVLLARDVRIARRFGLVPADWDEKRQLPAEVVTKLEQWRADAAQERKDMDRQIAAAENGKRLRLEGTVKTI